ncbi:uncharacterized protein LOC125845725 [Solanum stenotomum]|uniref:uncharacterized protein LOC125845725 n=1 Tax=Solanum stenotomum TaxID=172797 RepID=UPI0020D13BAA|nr:uncharacterized protein LOC125845725 [Solanum stenotomum]
MYAPRGVVKISNLWNLMVFPTSGYLSTTLSVDNLFSSKIVLNQVTLTCSTIEVEMLIPEVLELMMPPQRAVRGRPARWNIEEQRVSNAPEVKPKGEVTNAEFWEAIRMLSQVVTNQVGQQRGARQEETDTSRIREFFRMNPPSFSGSSTTEDLEILLRTEKEMVVDMRSTMSLFMARLSRLSSKEGKVAILIGDMDIARNKGEYNGQNSQNFMARPTQSQSSKAQGGNWAPAYA